MKVRILILTVLPAAAALLMWRVEWDRAFLPARMQQDMTERSRTPLPHLTGAIPFGCNRQTASADLLYRQHCAACHGESGTPAAYLANYPGMPQIPQLCPPPQDTSTWADSISRGRGAMPSYSSLLTPEQIQAQVAHIPTLKQKPSAPSPIPRPVKSERAHAPISPPASIPFAWGRALASFLLSLPLGMVFVCGIIPRQKGGPLPGTFEKSLALTMGAAAVSTAAGLALWGGSAFTLPALAFAGGLACHTLFRCGDAAPGYPSLQTAALSIAAYALAIPLLVGHYLPGASLPRNLTIMHGVCLSVLVVLALLLPIRSLRTPRALMLHAIAVLLVLAGAHALLGCCL